MKEKGWLKFLRFTIYLVSIASLAIGIGLIKNANSSSSYANGTHEAKYANGLAIFIPALVILSCNIFLGDFALVSAWL